MLPVPTDPPPRDGVLRHLGFDGCVRLPLRVDAARLAGELDRLPAGVWGRAGRDPVVLGAVESLYVVGQPVGAPPGPAGDLPVLEQLPYLREVLRERVPATPIRGIVARQRAGGLVPIHTDTLRHFRGTVRLSIQVAAGGPQGFYCNGLRYALAAGEVWAIDNLRPHGIQNAESEPRTSVIVDYLPSDALARLILDGEHDLGRVDEAGRAALAAETRAHYRRNRWRSLRYEASKLLRRWRR
jgi:kumamolisin